MSAPQKFHCVTQLREDSWEYRLKRPDEDATDDDLVAWTDYLRLHDRLLTEQYAQDARRVAEIARIRTLLAEAWRERDEVKATLATLLLPAGEGVTIPVRNAPGGHWFLYGKCLHCGAAFPSGDVPCPNPNLNPVDDPCGT